MKSQLKFSKLKSDDFYMTLEDFKTGFKSYTITYLQSDFKASFLEKRSSVSKRLYKFNFVVPIEAPTKESPASDMKLAELTDQQPRAMTSLRTHLQELAQRQHSATIDDEINLELENELEEQAEEAEEGDNLAQSSASRSGALHEAFVGAELYNKRMFPQGCPSYQKAFVKLYRFERGMGKNKVLRLLATQFFSNRDGFGFINRRLKPGEYQIHFKKYSSAFDVFDFTVKVLSNIDLKLVDEEEHEIQKVKISEEQMKKIPKIGAEAAQEKKTRAAAAQA